MYADDGAGVAGDAVVVGGAGVVDVVVVGVNEDGVVVAADAVGVCAVELVCAVEVACAVGEFSVTTGNWGYATLRIWPL